VADKLFPVFKRTSGISPLLLLVFVVVLYGRELISALGSFAIAAQVLFVLGMAFIYELEDALSDLNRSTTGCGVNLAPPTHEWRRGPR
jgi:hypothetical protein